LWTWPGKDGTGVVQSTDLNESEEPLLRSTNAIRLSTVAALISSVVLLLAFAGNAAAATRTITFQELEKGSTFAFIDNAPTSELRHGFPVKISAGDQFVGTNPLASGGKKIGELRTLCVATKSVSAKNFDAAGFICSGTFTFGGQGTLVASAVIGSHSGTEGAIVGGTGIYANARGTFVTKEGKGTSTVTVNLVE
jgi:hypothetical protein